jgi:hypothetical protein
VTAEYSSSEIVGINVRGFTGDMTTFSADAVPQVNANSTSNRAFNMMALALNDIARCWPAGVCRTCCARC